MAILKKTQPMAPDWDTTHLSFSNSIAAGNTQVGQFYVDDVLTGGSGNDWLYGLSGDDTLSGQNGNDLLHGGAGADTLFGGKGIDTASYAWSMGDLEISLSNHSGKGGDAAGDQIWEIENVIGSDGDDTIAGDKAANYLDGGKGDDSITGSDGDDYLAGGGGDDLLNGYQDNDTADGGDGADQIWGSNGDDVLHGGAGADFLSGGEGMDILIGDTGADSLGGGNGVDTFVFYAALPDLMDVITDFDPNQDILRLNGVSDANDPDVQVVTNEAGFVQLNFFSGGGVVLEGVNLGNVTTLAQVDAAINIQYVA